MLEGPEERNGERWLSVEGEDVSPSLLFSGSPRMNQKMFPGGLGVRQRVGYYVMVEVMMG